MNYRSHHRASGDWQTHPKEESDGTGTIGDEGQLLSRL
jgi:hypothetical protein